MTPPISIFEYIIYYSLWIIEQLVSYIFNIPKRYSLKVRFSQSLLKKLEKNDDTIIKKVDTYKMGELSDADFIKNYVLPGKPVVIKSVAKNWPCCKEWSLDFFRQNYGEENLPFLDSNSDDYIYKEAPLKQICEDIEAGSTKYAKFSGLILKYPKLLDYFDKTFMKSTLAVRHLESSVQLFIGGKKSSTNIHTAISNVSFIQVHGNKKWLTLPKDWTPILNPIIDTQPQFMADPIFNNLDENSRKGIIAKLPFIKVELEAGDFFFNPAYT
ncbi:cupin-like domain-containing protein [Halobacteriovorax sp. HLS]|uniref:cupin-like domain-containing protein n=1 Tax=Halobacteriovorax sp. HLS TaxID=2234000 RepID=UPI000FD9BCB9|nr:cupin-like domain-containing protein [Halobacteriovorax sp. HLS]